MKNITILGCGSWGGTLGKLLSEKNNRITMWHRNSDIIENLIKTRKHYIVKDLTFSNKILFKSDISKSIWNADIIVLALPTQVLRERLKANKKYFQKHQIIVNVSKGIEIDSLMTVSEIVKDVLGNNYTNLVTLSGPSHAEEVLKKNPTAIVAASEDIEIAKVIQKLFATEMLRTYLNKDLRGVELGGAMKNVIAIAAGMCDGIGYGDNSKAALMTRGMAEIVKLGNKMGANPKTFRGLSGYGDLIVTCLSRHSRNRSLGQSIGEGKALKNVISDMNMVAEGVSTSKSVHQLAEKYNIEMPIHEAIYNVLFREVDPKLSVYELMNRKLSEEL